MRKFILNTIIVLVAVVTLDQVVGFVLDNKFATSAFEPASKALNNQYDLVLLGPSEMQNQYVIQIIVDSLNVSAYNYGSGGQNIYSQYILLNLIINHSNHLPKYVLYEPSNIDFYDQPGWNLEKLDVYFPLYNIDDSLRSVVSLKGWQTSLLLKNVMCYKHNSLLHQYLKRFVVDTPDDSELGYMPVEPVDFSDNLETVGTTANEVLDSMKIDYIYRLIHLCKDNNISLIFVNAPYYELHDSVLWMDTLKQIIAKECVPFLNYDNDPYFIEHRELYYNRVHFNKYGAVEYTKRIISDLRVLINN